MVQSTKLTTELIEKCYAILISGQLLLVKVSTHPNFQHDSIIYPLIFKGSRTMTKTSSHFHLLAFNIPSNLLHTCILICTFQVNVLGCCKQGNILSPYQFINLLKTSISAFWKTQSLKTLKFVSISAMSSDTPTIPKGILCHVPTPTPPKPNFSAQLTRIEKNEQRYALINPGLPLHLSTHPKFQRISVISPSANPRLSNQPSLPDMPPLLRMPTAPPSSSVHFMSIIHETPAQAAYRNRQTLHPFQL